MYVCDLQNFEFRRLYFMYVYMFKKNHTFPYSCDKLTQE